jgi:hypothetical protein
MCGALAGLLHDRVCAAAATYSLALPGGAAGAAQATDASETSDAALTCQGNQGHDDDDGGPHCCVCVELAAVNNSTRQQGPQGGECKVS